MSISTLSNKGLSNKYNHRLFASSFFFLILYYVALFYESDYMALVDLILFLTSIFYWNFPLRDSIQRKIDIFMVFVWLVVHNYQAINMSSWDQNVFFFLNISGLCCYLLSVYNDGNDHISSIFHNMLHFTGLISASYMYFSLK